ncbi:MAG: TonB family protein [Bacteroidales bacterium]|nr:TonB family protein [Bacteroidales bacterium]MBP5374079.1 TonB family protein [Bacteroidales bacterium]
MQPYQRTRGQREKHANVNGILLTLAAHALLLVLLLTSGLKYLDPPPPERTSLLIEFTELEEETRPEEKQSGREPQAEQADPEREVELVQKAESPYQAQPEKPNVTPETAPDPHGDVETPTPPVKEEPKLDPRASFPGMAKQDNSATTPHAASEPSAGFKAGQADGNTKEGRTQGHSNAHLQGRSLMGSLPRPSYNAQMEGIVVVRIKVDQYGHVTEAIPGAEGTTVTDRELWNAARNAAMKANFNASADAPDIQTGTITYVFKLK